MFESDVNEVRARTQIRVQMHQELSTNSMKLPSSQKVRQIKDSVFKIECTELGKLFDLSSNKNLISFCMYQPDLKPIVPSTLTSRLDRMFNKVLVSIEEPKRPTINAKSLGSISRRMTRTHTIAVRDNAGDFSMANGRHMLRSSTEK